MNQMTLKKGDRIVFMVDINVDITPKIITDLINKFNEISPKVSVLGYEKVEPVDAAPPIPSAESESESDYNSNEVCFKQINNKVINVIYLNDKDRTTKSEILSSFIEGVDTGVWVAPSSVDRLEQIEIDPESIEVSLDPKLSYKFLKSNTYQHAERELNLINVDDGLYKDSIRTSLYELLQVFWDQGHSGMSANIVSDLFNKLSRFEILSPLTGEASEWGTPYAIGIQQNIRASNVFRDNGMAYQMDYYIFKDKNGCGYTNKKSRKNIESFPYTPGHEYINDETCSSQEDTET